MDCRECNELLPLYIDTSLSAEEMRAIKQHLDACRPCHEEFVKLSDTLELVCKLEKVDPPADFHARFMSRFNEECKPKKTWNWWGTLSLSSVAAAAMVLLVVVLYHPLNDLEVPAPRLSSQAPAEMAAQPPVAEKKQSQKAEAPRSAESEPSREDAAEDEVRALAKAPAVPASRAAVARPRRRAKSMVTSVSLSDSAAGASASRAAAPQTGRTTTRIYRQAGEWSGSKSNVRAPRNQVVRSEAALKALWQSAEIKSAPRPQVDWRRQMVGAIFLGDQPGQGHEILLHEIQRTAEGPTVKYHVKSPSTITGSSSRPFLIFILPYSRQPVKFQSE